MKAIVSGLAAVALFGCAGAPSGEERSGDAPEATATVSIVSPSASASVTASALASAAPPSAESTAPPQDDLPPFDCATLPASPAPSPRWLCEHATNGKMGELFDKSGFAFVTQFDTPEENPADPNEGHTTKRVCDEREAARRFVRLSREIRFKQTLVDPTDPYVRCKGMTCELRSVGEWSTAITLKFRPTPTGPVLDAWSEIETAAVDPAEVAKREGVIAKGLKATAKVKCTASK